MLMMVPGPTRVSGSTGFRMTDEAREALRDHNTKVRTPLASLLLAASGGIAGYSLSDPFIWSAPGGKSVSPGGLLSRAARAISKSRPLGALVGGGLGLGAGLALGAFNMRQINRATHVRPEATSYNVNTAIERVHDAHDRYLNHMADPQGNAFSPKDLSYYRSSRVKDTKTAGYYQNVVGFDDPTAARHTEAMQALNRARSEGDAWSRQFDAANTGGRMSMYTSQMKRQPARPEQRLTRGIVGGLAGGYAGLGISMLAKGRAKAPLAVAGALSGALAGALAPGKKREVYTKNPGYDQEAHQAYLQQHPSPEDELDYMENRWEKYGPKEHEDFGRMGKYVSAPEMLFGEDRDLMMGDPIENHKGYVTLDELREIRKRFDGYDPQTTKVLDAAIASGKKYFTSSDFG